MTRLPRRADRPRRRPREEHEATSRAVVVGWLLLGCAAIAGLTGLAEALRLDHPPAGPVTAEVAGAVDGLRQDVVCELPAGREGDEREEAASQPSLPVPVTSNELYDCPTTWDGRRVTYRGEVVGAVLRRGPQAWLQLNDDVYAGNIGPLPTHRDFRGGNAGAGALVPAAAADAIRTVGGPTQRGDIVEVVAVFHRVHEPSGEVAVLAVESLEVVREGTPLEVPTSPARAVAAIVAATIAAGVVVVERRNRTR